VSTWVIVYANYTLKEAIYMKKVIINENQKGLLFKNGKLVKMLNAGAYLNLPGRKFFATFIESELVCPLCSADKLLENKEIAENTVVCDVADGELAIHMVNGSYEGVLEKGRHLFWKNNSEHEFKLIDITRNYVEGIPAHILSKIPEKYYYTVVVDECCKARLYFDKKFEKLLDAGTYRFWYNGVRVDVNYVDTRLMQLNITGQEILTLDKVAVRVNLVCNYRITDYVKIASEIDDYKEQLHVATQLALREYVGRFKLDELLENKEDMAKYIYEKLKKKESELYISITDAGVKDIILPGEIRDIMNTVLIAEKRAQANVITRREEVASTRSLLNTAKLMDENETLYKLKELEYIEKICENVGSINLNGNGDVLTQLAGILGKR
jgi:regulator of protease activity HflC (stomatin/prohibitin superfamily)